jgi:hypothetical protein
MMAKQLHGQRSNGYVGVFLSVVIAFGMGVAGSSDYLKSNMASFRQPNVVAVESAQQLLQSGVLVAKQLVNDDSALEQLIAQFKGNSKVVKACNSNSPPVLNPTEVIRRITTPDGNHELIIHGAFAPSACGVPISSKNYSLSFKIASGVNCSRAANADNGACVVRSTVLSVSRAPSTTGCVWALSTNETGFRFNSNNTVMAPDCEFHAHSPLAESVVWNHNNAVELKQLNAAGKIRANGPWQPWFNEQAGAKVAADPFERGLPQPVGKPCDFNSFGHNGPLTMNPGVYCGLTKINAFGAEVHMKPGLYVFKDADFKLNDVRLIATGGVTLFFENGDRLVMNDGSSLRLKAPTAGPYAGLALYERYGSAAAFYPFDAQNGLSIEGLVYLPSKQVVFNSGSGLQSLSIALVVRNMIFSSMNWTIQPYSGSIVGSTMGGQQKGSLPPVLGAG